MSIVSLIPALGTLPRLLPPSISTSRLTNYAVVKRMGDASGRQLVPRSLFEVAGVKRGSREYSEGVGVCRAVVARFIYPGVVHMEAKIKRCIASAGEPNLACLSAGTDMCVCIVYLL